MGHQVIIDEVPMVPGELLGAFEHHLANAAVDSSVRVFGGYNVLGFGDFYQTPTHPSVDIPEHPASRQENRACDQGSQPDVGVRMVTTAPWKNAGTARYPMRCTTSWSGYPRGTQGLGIANGRMASTSPARWKQMEGGAERSRRNRLLDEVDPRVREEPFLSAPFNHENREPTYQAMLLQAAEQSKTDRKHTVWFAAACSCSSDCSVSYSSTINRRPVRQG